MDAPVGFSGTNAWTIGVSSGLSPSAPGARPCQRGMVERSVSSAAGAADTKIKIIKAARQTLAGISFLLFLTGQSVQRISIAVPPSRELQETDEKRFRTHRIRVDGNRGFAGGTADLRKNCCGCLHDG